MKMRFYGVHEGLYEGVAKRIDLFRTSCEQRAIEYVDVDALTVDFTTLPQLTRKDMLYSLSRGSELLMSMLLNEEVTTFYRSNPRVIESSSIEWSIQHQKAGLSAPLTVFSLTADRDLLKVYVEYVGGFPLVLKIVGGTRGIGTIKIDGWPGLLSTADHLVASQSKFIMREFIQARHGARAMVLGGRVIASASFQFQENDFRNAPILAATRYEPISLDPHTEALCIAAVDVIGLEMGGVDVLFDSDQKAYLLEVNFPTGFQAFDDSQSERITGAMVEHLVRKAKQ